MRAARSRGVQNQESESQQSEYSSSSDECNPINLIQIVYHHARVDQMHTIDSALQGTCSSSQQDVGLQ